MSCIADIYVNRRIGRMGEKAKNTIMEILKSDDMRKYLEEILQNQTTEIISSFHALEETRLNEELQTLKTMLSEEQKKEKEHLEKLYDEKKADCERILQQKLDFENQLAVQTKKNEQLMTSITELRNRIEGELQSEKAEKAVVTSKLEEYEKKYGCINRAFYNYLSLPEGIKQRMGNIFVRENVYSFIVAVSEWDNIEGIWSFTKRRIIEDEGEGLSELIALFVDAFALFNLIKCDGRYELINPEVGERFDFDRHSIKGIKTDGIIEEVLL